jgi:CheY-like chemotaxis protein
MLAEAAHHRVRYVVLAVVIVLAFAGNAGATPFSRVRDTGCVAATTGAEAVAIACHERPALVLLDVQHGGGTETIAETLHISPKTVATHVQRILAKLDVHSRAEAVAFAYRHGLVEASSVETGVPALR